MAFMDHVQDMFPHTLVATPVTHGGGGEVSYGTPINIKCTFREVSRNINTANGRETRAGYDFTTADYNSLSVDGYEFDLPVGCEPRLAQKALSVSPVSDEIGFIYEIIRF